MYHTRDRKPTFKNLKNAKSDPNLNTTRKAMEPKNSIFEPPLAKRMHVKAANTEPEDIDSMMDTFFDQYYRQIPGFSTMISDFYTNIYAQE